MRIAGVEIDNRSVLALAGMLRAEYYFKAAGTLEQALADGRPDAALTIRERTAILDVLDDPPHDLDELRRVLLEEHEWRTRLRLTREPVR